MATRAGNYRNCIYFKMWVKILPYGTVIAQATKGFVSFSKQLGEYWWVPPFALFSPFSISYRFCLFEHFFPSGSVLYMILLLLHLHFVVSSHSKSKFMHSDGWFLLFYIFITAFYLQPLQLFFSFYQKIPSLLARVWLS